MSSFHKESTDLCEAIAMLGRRICQNFVDPDGLTAYTSCRLVAMDKCPGVRPIGIGEVVRRIIGKAILSVASQDIQQVTGALQLCAGQQAGCEAAIHAMRQGFTQPNTEAVLRGDATNAFNCLNRKVALQNILRICPSVAPALVNCYRSDAHLFVGGEVIPSSEGTTQGDPLATALFAIATIPPIHRLKESSSASQVWFADDATAGGELQSLKQWWDELERIGPDFGYFANASKSWLIVKEENMSEAANIFANTGVQITKEGRRNLGAALGTQSFTEEFVSKQVQKWTEEVKRLATIAESQPHAAYSALTHGLAGKWSYLSRTVSNITDLLLPLGDAIRHHLIPALTGRTGITDMERELLALPTRLGGLSILDPSKTCNDHFRSSQRISAPLTALILQQEMVCPSSVPSEQISIKNKIKAQRRQEQTNQAAKLRDKLPSHLQQAMDFGGEKGASHWLVVLPLSEHGFTLHKGAFRDAIKLRYGWQLPHLPSHCTCGKKFTVEHAFSCPCGGFPSLRHNDIRDITADFLTEVSPSVAVEPALQPLTGEQLQYKMANSDDDARADVSAQGFWGDKRQLAFFDVRVFNPIAPSCHNSSQASMYRRHENEKRRAYQQRILEVEHGSFTPLVFSATGGMGPAATVTYKRIASLLAEKRAEPYSKTIGWLRCTLNFSLIRSAIQCIRGARSTRHRPCRPPAESSIALATEEGRIPCH